VTYKNKLTFSRAECGITGRGKKKKRETERNLQGPKVKEIRNDHCVEEDPPPGTTICKPPTEKQPCKKLKEKMSRGFGRRESARFRWKTGKGALTLPQFKRATHRRKKTAREKARER